MVKEVIRTDNFIRQLLKFDKSYLERVEKIVNRVLENPEVGKPMKYSRKGTRELYVKPFRLSYAYDKEREILYFLDIYHKDKQ